MVLLPTPPLRECVTTILAISLQSGIRTSLRCGWRAFRRVTVVTVDRWNSGTAGRCSGNSLQRRNVVTLGAVTWYRRWSGRRRSGQAPGWNPVVCDGDSPLRRPAPVAGDVYVGGWGARPGRCLAAVFHWH